MSCAEEAGLHTSGVAQKHYVGVPKAQACLVFGLVAIL